MIESFNSTPDNLEENYPEIIDRLKNFVMNKESTETSFGGIRLSYNGRYEVPGINQETILSNKYKSQFPDTGFSDCRLDLKPRTGERMGTVVCGNALITSIDGKNSYEPHKESYYSQRVLPGPDLVIPGRHVAEDGTIRDKDGFIVIASPGVKKGQVDPYPKGTKIMTTLGPGKVYDKGHMTGKWFDIYTDWDKKRHRDKSRDWKYS